MRKKPKRKRKEDTEAGSSPSSSDSEDQESPPHNKYDPFRAPNYIRKYEENSNGTKQFIVFLSNNDNDKITDKNRLTISLSLKKHCISGVKHLQFINKFKIGVVFDTTNNANTFLSNFKFFNDLNMSPTIPAAATEVTGVLTHVPIDMSNKKIFKSVVSTKKIIQVRRFMRRTKVDDDVKFLPTQTVAVTFASTQLPEKTYPAPARKRQSEDPVRCKAHRMSWLRGSPFPFGRQVSRALDPRTDYEPSACFQTFCKHWQQALHIISSTQGTESAQQDAVLGVVSHVEQTATLLVLEARARDLRGSGMASAAPPACLYHLLSENLLRCLYDWSLNTGRYMNAVRVEQLKLYSVLLSCYGQQALAAEPLLRPLLQLLHACCGELLPQPVEGELVALLGQLCVVLMQNLHLVDLFFMSNKNNDPAEEFVPVRLLLGSVHGEGAAGAGARDALLLCANMSARHSRLAVYLHIHSDACVLLATGLSGLYSLLPRTLAASHLPPERARLGADHVAAVPKLSLFIDSLEFCDAVAQVSPPKIRRQLLDFFYQGFLVPVMGPALLQPRALQSGLAEQTTAVAYLELCVRCASARGLLRPLLRFLLLYSYDDVRLLDVLLAPRRLQADTQLSVVSLGLLETLVELNCEDVLLELVYRHLLSASAPAHSLREETWECEAYREGAAAFLALAPACCARRPATPAPVGARAHTLAHALSARSGDIALDTLLTDSSLYYANPHESLLGNYHAYLCDARHALETRALACARWTSLYPLTLQASAPAQRDQEHDSLTSLGESSGYDSFRCRHDDHDDSEDTFAEDAFWSDSGPSPATPPLAPRLVSMSQHKRETGAGGGPLLAVLLQKASRLLQCELHTAALITGLLSKLAAFPTPALSTLLLCPSVPCPHSPSLYQVLSDLKREADEVTRSCSEAPALVERARAFLVRRELAHARRRLPAPHNNNNNINTDDAEEAAVRRVSVGAAIVESGGGGGKRRSFSSSLSHMLARGLAGMSSPPVASPQTRAPGGDGGDADKAFWSTSASRRALLNTVLLDEWLKELSALAHQHALRSAAPPSARLAPLGL